jgi:RHS repeat-associated protein
VQLYDGDSHVGLPEGEIAAGNLTASYVLALTNEMAAEIYGQQQPDWEGLGYVRVPGDDGWWIREHSYERSFSEAGLTLRIRGARGFETTLEYDSTLQFPRAITDAVGNRVVATVDRRAMQVAALVDANGHESRDRFDLLGRVTAMITPGTTEERPSTRLEYLTATLPVRVATFQLERHDGDATLDRFDHWDGWGRLLQKVVEGEGDDGRRFLATETIAYNARGQIRFRYLPRYQEDAEYSPPPASWPRQELRYDAVGRLVERRRPDGTRIAQRFEPGAVLGFDEHENQKPEAERRPVIHRLDSTDRVVEIARMVGENVVQTSYRYDHEGRLVETRSPNGAVSSCRYDLLGRVLVEQTVATGVTLYRLDAAGNQVARTTASGKIVENGFDALNRLTWTRQQGEALPELERTYLDSQDEAPDDGVRNRRARLWRVRDALGTVTFAYDQAGRVVQKRRVLSDQPSHALVSDLEYDALGRQVRAVLPAAAPGGDRHVVQTLFNRRGLAVSSPGIVLGADYDVFGNATRIVYQNGVENHNEFDPASSRPTRLRVIGPGQQVLRDQRFAFDALGNLLRIDSPIAAEALTAEYDDAARLLHSRYGSGDEYSWAYDVDGSVTRSPELGEIVSGGMPGSGQVSAAGGGEYTWSEDGHLSSAPWGAPRFDALDNLVAIDLATGGTVHYRYDYRGLRASRRGADGKISIYADDGLELHDGVPLFWIDFGERRIQAVDGGGRALFLHADLWGTPTLFTGLAGEEVARLGVTPYGSLRFVTGALSIPEPLRFTGQGADRDTGLLVLGRRFYDPRLARFVSPDSLVGGIFRLDGWNRYAYAHGNPLRYVDPSGADAADVFGWLGVLALAVAALALIAAGIVTAGATWPAAGVVGSMMFGAGVGMMTGMVLGGLSAQLEGGSVLHGMLFGMMAGGMTGLFGGLFGSAAGGAVGTAVTKAISETAATYFQYFVHGTIAGALTGFGTGATLGFAGGKGSVESMLEHMWKGAILGGVIGGLMGLGAAYIEANPYLNISTQKFEAMKQGTWNAIDWSQKQAGTLGTIRIATSAGDVYSGAGLGAAGMFVGLSAKEAGLSFSLKWTVPLIMNIGVYQAPSLFLAFDKYEVITLGQAIRFGVTLAPFGWLHEVTGFWDTSWGSDMRSGLDEFYPKPG